MLNLLEVDHSIFFDTCYLQIYHQAFYCFREEA